MAPSSPYPLDTVADELGLSWVESIPPSHLSMSMPHEHARRAGLKNPQMAGLSSSTPALNLTGRIVSLPPHTTTQGKLLWASESCASLRQPKPVLGSPAKQLKLPVRQISAHAYGVKAASFGSTDPRFDLGEQSLTPGGRIHTEARRASQAALAAASLVAAHHLTAAHHEVGRSKASAKVGGELPIHCLEPPESVPFGVYDPKTDGVGAQKSDAPKWRFDFKPVHLTRAKPEWNPQLHGYGGPVQYEDKAWMSAFSRKRVSSTQPNEPQYSFAPTPFGTPYASPSRTEQPGAFCKVSPHEMRWVAPGIADAKQLGSRRPSSAFGAFGTSGSSRFDDDDPRGRPAARAGAATSIKPSNRGGVVRPKSAWSGEERGCLEDHGGAVSGVLGGSRRISTPLRPSNPLRFGRIEVATPAPSKYTHAGTQPGQRYRLRSSTPSAAAATPSRGALITFQAPFSRVFPC